MGCRGHLRGADRLRPAPWAVHLGLAQWPRALSDPSRRGATVAASPCGLDHAGGDCAHVLEQARLQPFSELLSFGRCHAGQQHHADGTHVQSGGHARRLRLSANRRALFIHGQPVVGHAVLGAVHANQRPPLAAEEFGLVPDGLLGGGRHQCHPHHADQFFPPLL